MFGSFRTEHLYSIVTAASNLLLEIPESSFHKLNGRNLFWFSFTRFCYARNLLPTTELEEKWTGSNAIGLSSFSLDSAYFQCLPQCPFSSAALIEAEVCFEGFHCVRPLKGLLDQHFLCFLFCSLLDCIFSITRRFPFVNTFFADFSIFL